MIALWFSALAAQPTTVVSFDNGGFNLPMYTSRWNGRFSQPSVAQQLTSDIARLQGQSPRVFTYLPPGTLPGRSSDPFEVVPPEDCAPGERCWTALDVSRDPAASTSLYQAVTAIRERVSGPRIEVHFTDLFEEDPSAAENPADADQCVTEAGTRKALEALLRPSEGSLDHVAVGFLTATIDPPRSPSGGAVEFVEEDGGCWSARRTRTFGGGTDPLEFAMGVVIIGVDTAFADEDVRRFIGDLQRQISAPLTLDLVVVREPPTQGTLAGGALPASDARVALGDAPPRSTPCDTVQARVDLSSGPEPLAATDQASCTSLGTLSIAQAEISRVFNHQAGLNPLTASIQVNGAVHVRGTSAPIRAAVESLGQAHQVADRPLPFWGALTAAMRFDDGDGVWRPREHYVTVQALTLTDADDRPWGLAFLFALFLFGGVTVFGYLLLNRFAANRAFRRHLGSANAAGRPVAAVLAEAAEEAQAGWMLRLAVAAGLGGIIGVGAALILLLAHGARLG